MTLTNRDIYKNALSLVGELVTNNTTADYEERAEYILPSFFCVAKNIDKNIRKAEGKEDQPTFSPVYAPLNNEFPFCDSLVSTAALYLASMLVIDEDEDLSDSLYDKYCDNLASVAASVTTPTNVTETETATCEPIVQKYFFD